MQLKRNGKEKSVIYIRETHNNKVRKKGNSLLFLLQATQPLRRLGWHLGVLLCAVLKALVGRVLACAVGHKVLVLGGSLLGLVGTSGALAPEVEA